jgi:hypothetical protein
MIQRCNGPTDKDLVKAYGLEYSVLNSLKIIHLQTGDISQRLIWLFSLYLVLRATLCKFFILLLHRATEETQRGTEIIN